MGSLAKTQHTGWPLSHAQSKKRKPVTGRRQAPAPSGTVVRRFVPCVRGFPTPRGATLPISAPRRSRRSLLNPTFNARSQARLAPFWQDSLCRRLRLGIERATIEWESGTVSEGEAIRSPPTWGLTPRINSPPLREIQFGRRPEGAFLISPPSGLSGSGGVRPRRAARSIRPAAGSPHGDRQSCHWESQSRWWETRAL